MDKNTISCGQQDISTYPNSVYKFCYAVGIVAPRIKNTYSIPWEKETADGKGELTNRLSIRLRIYCIFRGSHSMATQVSKGVDVA